MKVPESWTYIRSIVGPDGDPLDAIWPGYEMEWRAFRDWVNQQIALYTKDSPEIGLWRTRLPESVASIPKRLKAQAMTAFRNTIKLALNQHPPMSEERLLSLCKQNWDILYGQARAEVTSRLTALAATLKSWYEPFVRPYLISFSIITVLRQIWKYFFKTLVKKGVGLKISDVLYKTVPGVAGPAGAALGKVIKWYGAIRRTISLSNILDKILDLFSIPPGVAAVVTLPTASALAGVAAFLLGVFLPNFTVQAPELSSREKSAALWDPRYGDLRTELGKLAQEVDDIEGDIQAFGPPQDPQHIRDKINSLHLSTGDEYLAPIKAKLLSDLEKKVHERSKQRSYLEMAPFSEQVMKTGGGILLGAEQVLDDQTIDALADSTFDAEKMLAILWPDIEHIKQEDPDLPDDEVVKQAAALHKQELEALAENAALGVIDSVGPGIDVDAVEEAGEACEAFEGLIHAFSRDKGAYQRVAQQLDDALPRLPDDIRAAADQVRGMVQKVLEALHG